MDNVPLPSPRLISSLVHRNIPTPPSQFTTMLMQFGQFLDHDLTCKLFRLSFMFIMLCLFILSTELVLMAHLNAERDENPLELEKISFFLVCLSVSGLQYFTTAVELS